MPSTYSTNLKLELMATGENSGTWGTKTNTNLGTLLEQAIVGAATVAMADTNQTISITDGVSSDGRAVYIKCTGALTAGRNLVVPTLNKNYIVENATTGGFDITVKTTAGTGIAVKPSTKRAVYADATNVVEALSGFGNTTVSGTLDVSGAVTGGTYNKVTVTAPAAGSTLTIADGKTLTASNTVTLTGTDATTYNLNAMCPVGTVMPYAGSAAPTTWLLCYGQAVSRATYSVLFGVVGTTYGSGDGATTFNLPDLRGRLPAGKDDMGGVAAGRLTATSMSPDALTAGATGGFQTRTAATTSTGSTTTTPTTGVESASVSVTAGGATVVALQNHVHNQTVMNVSVSGTSAAFVTVQPTIILNYIIQAGV